MKNRYLIPFLTSSAIALSISPAWGKAETTPEITFACEGDGDVPITVAKNSQGKTQPIFHWKQETLPSKPTPQQLCTSVAEKLNKYAAEGYDLSKLGFRATDETGLPAICVTEEYSGCNALLFTLSPIEKHANATSDILTAILERKILDRGNPRESLKKEDLWLIVDLFKLFKNEE